MRKNYVLLLLIMFSYSMYAQKVTGVVKDENNAPLSGVTIVVKGTLVGTITDFDGKYEVKAVPGDKLIFSYVGYNTLEETVEGTTLNVTMKPGVSLNEIVLVGSRNPARTAVNSLAPVDVIDVSEILGSSPQVNLNQILNFVAPSFTSNTQTIADGTDHIDPASLRGLGPDQVLVLINGKRRHTSSLVNVNGTFGRGSVGTDLNAIPTAAIRRIEVLRDGAAAQYGSDAIAGVINIVLDNATNELKLNITTGANFTKNANEQTGGVDGATTNISANYGLKLGDRGGYINFTGDFDYRDDYNRMREWEGDIFNKYNTVERFASADGYDLSKLLDDDVNDVINYGNQAGFNLDPNASKADLRTLLGANNTDAELASRNLNRSDFNMRVGQSEVRGGRFFTNFSLPLDDNGSEIYSFGGLSSRTGNSGGFYRLPNQSRTYTPAYINGFLPEINSTITDQSLSVGVKGKLGDWNTDFSNTYGKNAFIYTIGNTFNASLQNASPTTFDAGGFNFAQNTVNLDLNHFYEDIFSGLNVAFGAEYRLENYVIFAGEAASYLQYTAQGEGITLASQQPSVDFFGNKRPGGSQVFPGFSPKNEVERGRNSVAGYIDLEADITDSFLLSLASRFENYSDFGSTINLKVAALLKVNESLNLRIAGNTGFRAPSLHQLYFNSTSTIFDQDGNPQEVGTFANDSRAAKLLGIPELKQETSKSISAGFTVKLPEVGINITLDGYFVAIDDRVVYTGQFSPKRDSNGVPIDAANAELANLLSQANATAASFFANAIDTESKGIDLVFTHRMTIGTDMLLKNDLAATLSKTKKVGAIKASRVLENADQVDTYFPEDSRVYLEEAVPRTKVNLSHTLSTGNFNFFLRNVFFGEVTEATTNIALQEVLSSKIVTDLSVGYNLTDSFLITVGANNLLDIYPDRLFNAPAGTDDNRSDGRFDWSRRAQQFGVGGRFLFARLSLSLK
ncbi:TonB-dependent receptor [Gelidibacter salicanalis]|uniref:TonB-dependent receptor n=1 Tax=Gelidibacter salicanalis TaxID=291193 RepID=A0A934NKL5_9FLAO|nr:TonB-dependent receptor [Gelidibacter salicanalis]MBJ7881222.1 TonB-dependent receptor [Gelidibacter salicanalis]